MKFKIVLFLLKGIASLPLGILYLFSDFLYLVIGRMLRYRKKVVIQNLTEAFPEKSPEEIEKIAKEYYHFLCDTIVETVKLLRISEKEMSRRVTVTNPEIVNEAVASNKSVVLFLGHYGNWEWVQEISRYLTSDAFQASIFKPLNSKLWGGIYEKIRSRWNVNILSQDKAVKILLSKENQPWICGFIADARERHGDDDAVVPFLNHYTHFIYGPEVIGRKLGAEFFFLEMDRVKRGYYSISFHRLEPDRAPEGFKYPYSYDFWKHFEKVIRRKPAYWLWSHRRWRSDSIIS